MDSTVTTYPLTISQHLAWAADSILTSNSSLTLLCSLIRWRGAWEPEGWNSALQQIVKDHEGLRLRLVQSGEKVRYGGEFHHGVRQWINPYQEFPVLLLDFNYPGGTADFLKWAARESGKRFPLLDHDLFCLTLVRLGPEENGLFIKVHHLIADAWSITLLYEQFFQRLQAIQSGETIGALESQELPASFVDFVLGQTTPRALEKAKTFLGFWVEKLMNAPAATRLLPNLPEGHTASAAKKTFTLPESLQLEIVRFSKRNHTSSYLFFLTGIMLYISLTNAKEDTSIGTIFHNRLEPKFQKTVGMFVNYLPLRVKVERSLDFHGLQNRTLTAWKQAIGRQSSVLSLEELVKVYEQANSLFDILISYENYFPEQPLEWFTAEPKLDGISVYLCIFDHPTGGIRFEFLYRTEIYSEGIIEEIFEGLVELWGNLVENPEAKIGSFNQNTRT